MIKKVLIVDDSPIARKMLKSCLPRDHEYELREAANGREGCDTYREFCPDVTFMDLTMPVMTGYDAIGEIMQYDKNAMIIVVTADVQLNAIKKVLDMGAFMVLKKPLKKDDIQSTLLRVQDVMQKAHR